ncbi:MAG: 2-C-methyl-D-erythritol 4-phosphate cytidylyltransferase [Propionicimonas sp.]|nr:2-C-methyl-D-erythritol 4-phosphate cytidylyltransferase [Propionicimonas sp.]
MPEPVIALVMAAGMGTRFGGPVPKPVAPLAGGTVIGTAIESLAAGGCTAVVVVVSRGAQHHFIPALAGCPVPLTVVEGGETRQESVLRGLEAIAAHPDLSGTGVILVHDAVRPLVPAAMVARVVDAVRAGAVAVTPAVPVVDSLRRVDADGSSRQVDRSDLRAIQTPQGFDFATLLASHRAAAAAGTVATDDVGVCESTGHQVVIVEGAASAFKITHADDLDLARALVGLAASEAAR